MSDSKDWAEEGLKWIEEHLRDLFKVDPTKDKYVLIINEHGNTEVLKLEGTKEDE